MTDPVRILYVDDDADIRTIVEMALSLDPALQVRSAGSGAAALRLLADDPWRPDAIILDVMMPGMDGIALLGALRTQPDLAAIPAVFLTARGHDSAAIHAGVHGVAGVILKPFDPIDLVGTVRKLIARARGDGAGAGA
ncbi:response regulator [Sphingomonas sp. CARO-RG-8B-R24-01]|uniref:response regulator n=1 Tax=Sphingomonas sp. CARO-RG-8B-R24-01 TaxID=2914831 RepID=UPI001F581F7F|nr:response regulator [Sphingomonas sp. CARO-RG-8B-R24-01]